LKQIKVKENGFAFVEFKRAENAVVALEQLDKMKYNNQTMFGKRASKKSVRKRDRSRGGSDSKKGKKKKTDEGDEEGWKGGDRLVSLAEPAKNEAKHSKDAVWLSSDEEDLLN
jgi:RNA recognition motif-containing protein